MARFKAKTPTGKFNGVKDTLVIMTISKFGFIKFFNMHTREALIYEQNLFQTQLRRNNIALSEKLMPSSSKYQLQNDILGRNVEWSKVQQAKLSELYDYNHHYVAISIL